jgi:hypothetical protein
MKVLPVVIQHNISIMIDLPFLQIPQACRPSSTRLRRKTMMCHTTVSNIHLTSIRCADDPAGFSDYDFEIDQMFTLGQTPSPDITIDTSGTFDQASAAGGPYQDNPTFEQTILPSLSMDNDILATIDPRILLGPDNGISLYSLNRKY